jgi:hypothetical protein
LCLELGRRICHFFWGVFFPLFLGLFEDPLILLHSILGWRKIDRTKEEERKDNEDEDEEAALQESNARKIPICIVYISLLLCSGISNGHRPTKP